MMIVQSLTYKAEKPTNVMQIINRRINDKVADDVLCVVSEIKLQ